MASEAINSSSSSFVGPALNTGHEEMNSTSSSNHSPDPTSRVDEYTLDDMFYGIPDTLAEEAPQASSVIPTLHDGSSSNQPIPSTVDNVNLAGTPSAQPELSMMSLSDFNFSSMDFMGELLNFDPTLFLNDAQHTIGSMLPGLIAPTDASVFSFHADNFLNTMFPTNMDGSSSSSSWLTQSPIVDHTQNVHMSMNVPVQQVPPVGSAGFIGSHEIDELTARARQVVGLTTAQSPAQPNKLPIPRLQHPASTTCTFGPSAKMCASSNASPSMQAVSSPSPSSGSMNSRTKLSHCTVERRYRTNMKEHLKNLRNVVPALRVLELKPGNRISNLSLKPGTLRVGIDADADVEGADVVDERGFIDGVKVAHNGSKTTAVLKTIEYIRVLQRRELRLKREQEGLKTLVRSFTGGAELLQQWEKMWQEKFGGPEKDELDKEDRTADMSNQDNKDSDRVDDGEDEPSMSGRDNRKRAKTDISPSTLKKVKKAASVPIDVPSNSAEAKRYVPIMPAQASLDSSHAPFVPVPTQPEKRKRGRPRKVPLPPLAVPNVSVHEAMIAQQRQRPIAVTSKAKEETVECDPAAARTESLARVQHQDAQSGHYLLAVFAFFSFFNTPLPFSSTSSFGVNRNTPFAQAHSGSVMIGPRLTANTTERSNSPIDAVAMSWRDAMQLAHLAFSVFLLFSVMRPRLRVLRIAKLFSRHLYSVLCGLHAVTDSLAASSALELSSVEKCSVPRSKVREAMHKLRVLGKDRLLVPAEEAQVYREALGLRTGIFGLALTLVRLVGIPEKHDYWRVERRAFIRLAELVALDANASISARLQIFISAFRFNYGCSYSATEMAILALVIQPIWRAKGAALWEFALGRVRGRGSSSPYIYKMYEVFVLESMSIDDTTLRISRLDRNAGARVLTSAADDDGASKGEDHKHREFASPLAVLARQAVYDHIRAQAEHVFMQTVSGEQDNYTCMPDEIDGANFDSSRLLAAGRSLDPLTVALVDLFDQVCNSRETQCDAAADLKSEGELLDGLGGAHAELQALLETIVLYRRIFASARIRSGRDGDARCRSSGSEIFTTMTLPSSPCRRNGAQDPALKRCLDSAAFNRTDALKKARNRVMDMMTMGPEALQD